MNTTHVEITMGQHLVFLFVVKAWAIWSIASTPIFVLLLLKRFIVKAERTRDFPSTGQKKLNRDAMLMGLQYGSDDGLHINKVNFLPQCTPFLWHL
ncbi:hypothetical protein RRG08_054522 [Elysia crispata]|uniref:Uncharacterized protein n=1 Tax=Elysia crispata TaxID=231223 RepID=A0AAE0ZIA8_9GAST|nr:hypothetical protein RRG08_054522 [Elysia crispata]